MNGEKGPSGLKIDALKEMCLETTLVAGGRGEAVVVIGEDPAHRALAERVVARIGERTGAQLPVVKAGGVEAGPLREQHVIALGNMADNAFIRWLYGQWWAVEDRCYPGAGGYALRTLHNLLGNGKNAVLVGASDGAGLERAASRFLALMPEGKSLTLGRLMEIELGPGFDHPIGHGEYHQGTVDSRPAAGWLQERRDHYIWQATQPHASAATAGGFLVAQAGLNGLMYHRTGHTAYAEAVREAVDAHRLMDVQGDMAHFNLWWLAVIWDLIEESPVFSDEDRLRITRHLLWIMDSREGAYYPFFRHGLTHRMMRQNHQTLVALAAWFGGRYFSTHYGMPEAREWMEASGEIFKGTMGSFKPVEDANAYQWTTLDHLLTYSLASGDMTYVENGNCRRSLDQAVFYCNNRGALPAFGDTSSALGGYPTNFLVKAGHVLQDGRAAFLLRLRGRRERLVRGFEKHFDDGLAPVEPSEMTGVTSLEVAQGFYEWAKDPQARQREVKPLNLPREQAFDTICFREGFGRDDQYLMLHGISYGNHGHEDGNTLVEFSANDRIFLVDASYTEGPTLKHHNGVTAVRDGNAWVLPALCRLDDLANLERVGMSRTSMEGAWGARWVRNMVWFKGLYFVAVDEVEATAAGSFALECHWRCLGRPELNGGRLEAVQRDAESGREDRFVLEGVGGDRVSLERDWENFGHWWHDYPYSDDYVNILHQSANREMAAGDRHTFIHLFYATNAEKPVDARMRRVGASAALVDGSGGRALVGTGGADSAFEVGPFSGSAAIYAVGEGWFALCGGTSLRCGEMVFESDTPVSIEFDVKRGQGRVVASGPVTLGLCGETLRLTAGEHTVRVGAGAVSLSLDEVAHFPEWQEARAKKAQGVSAPEVRTAWSRDLDSGVRCLASRGQGVVAGTEDGRVVALDEQGEVDWTFQAEDAVLSVCAADAHGAVAAGSNDRYLYLLGEGGTPRWSHRFEIFKGGYQRYARYSAVEQVKVADLRGKGQADILAAVSDRQLHCFDADGHERWSFMIYGIFQPLCVADVNGDGRIEVIGGPGRITCNGTCYVLDPDGKEIASNVLDAWASMMPGCDVHVDGEGGHLIACGTTRSHVYALRLNGDRLETLWRQRVGDEVHAVATADVDGDGRPEVAAGSGCFYLYLFDAEGTERWRRNLGAPVRKVLAADVNGDGHPEIVAGCEDGRVWIFDGEGRSVGVHRTEAKIHALVSDGRGHLLVGTSDGRLSVLCL